MAERGLTPEQMTERGVLRIHPAFRLVALAEPPVLGEWGGGRGEGACLAGFVRLSGF